MKAESGTSATRLRAAPVALGSLVVLFTLAVAQPLYNLLVQEDHATLFIAHQASAPDLYWLVGILSLGLPLIVVCTIQVLGRVSNALGHSSFLLVFFLLSLALACIAFRIYLDLSHPALDLLAFAVALAFTALYVRFEAVRLGLVFMCPVIVAAPALFLLHPAIQPLLADTGDGLGEGGTPGAEHPHIVFIIFDELPLVSLLDGKGQIDSARYPGFGRLATRATWYRNTNTIHYSTRFSIPSMLTGTDHWDRFGQYNTHRPTVMLAQETFSNNLLTLTRDTYKQYVLLSTVNADFNRASIEPFVPPVSERVPAMLEDLAIIYAHQAAPGFVVDGLPPIHGQWQDFLANDAGPGPSKAWPYLGGKPDRVRQLLEALHRSHTPVLYLVHVVLPHQPFRYNEFGQMHENATPVPDDRAKIPTGRNIWPSREVAARSQQAHLLQLGFVDRLLTRVLDRMDELRLLDESLLVVTADHGISYYWDETGMDAETLREVQTAEVVSVPLFIKWPSQRRAAVSDQVAQTLDILPTLADALDLYVPWPMDGVSLLRPPSGGRDRFAWLLATRQALGTELDAPGWALKRKLQMFGDGDMEGVYRLGPMPELLGRGTLELPTPPPGLEVRLEDGSRFNAIDPDGPRLPAWVGGRVFSSESQPAQGDLRLAISVNGVIRATAWAEWQGREWRFLARLPPGSFMPGHNDVKAHVIEGGGNSP